MPVWNVDKATSIGAYFDRMTAVCRESVCTSLLTVYRMPCLSPRTILVTGWWHYVDRQFSIVELFPLRVSGRFKRSEKKNKRVHKTINVNDKQRGRRDLNGAAEKEMAGEERILPNVSEHFQSHFAATTATTPSEVHYLQHEGNRDGLTQQATFNEGRPRISSETASSTGELPINRGPCSEIVPA